MTQVTLDHILQAAERIQVHRTPVMSSQTINEYASKESPVELFFKCELLQKTGCKKRWDDRLLKSDKIYPQHLNIEEQVMLFNYSHQKKLRMGLYVIQLVIMHKQWL
jgi:hypothetical protein